MEEYQQEFDFSGCLVEYISNILVYKFKRNTPGAKLHSHKFWEIGYVLRGKGFYRDGSSTHEISAGDVMITPPGHVHMEGYGDNQDIEILFLIFCDDFSPYVYFGLNFDSHVVFTSSKVSYIDEILRSILSETIEQKKGYEIYINADISRLFVSLYRLINNETLDNGKPLELLSLVNERKVRIVNEIIDYMEKNLSCKLQISKISRKFYISPQHMVRIFKEVTGQTPKEYFTRIKLNKAKDLLTCGEDEIWCIAENLGYSNVHYFYRVFKKETSTTPAMFRMMQTGLISQNR
jgi:AraC-like DNA-binding protein